MRSMARPSACKRRCRTYHAPVAATQNALVTYAASSMCGKRTNTARLSTIAPQPVGIKFPLASSTYPVGDCIQLLLTMIQNAERPCAKAYHEARHEIEP